MPATLQNTPTTDQLETGRQILLANDAALNASILAAENRLSKFESALNPAGIALGTDPITFTYPTLAAPGNPVSKGLQTFAGTGPDTDGQVAEVALTTTRRAVVSVESTTTGQPIFRTTVVNEDGAGVPAAPITATAGASPTANTSAVNIIGVERLSDTQFKWLAFVGIPGDGIFQLRLFTTT